MAAYICIFNCVVLTFSSPRPQKRGEVPRAQIPRGPQATPHLAEILDQQYNGGGEWALTRSFRLGPDLAAVANRYAVVGSDTTNSHRHARISVFRISDTHDLRPSGTLPVVTLPYTPAHITVYTAHFMNPIAPSIAFGTRLLRKVGEVRQVLGLGDENGAAYVFERPPAANGDGPAAAPGAAAAAGANAGAGGAVVQPAEGVFRQFPITKRGPQVTATTPLEIGCVPGMSFFKGSAIMHDAGLLYG